MCDSELMTPRRALEDTSILTPRKHSDGSTCDVQSGSCTMCSSPIGSSSDPKCDDELPELDQNDASDGENSNGGDACHDDDYDDFLREMAGSFENCEDDESDVGSGSEESSDEDDGTQAAGPVDEYDAFLRDMAGSFENCEDDESDVGSQREEPTKESKGQSTEFTDSMSSVEPIKFSSEISGSLEEDCLQSSDKGPTHSTTAHPPRSSFPAHTPVSKGRFLVTLLHPDQREPVRDDYDVAKATAEYAAQQPPRCCQNDKQQQQQRLRCCQIDEQREDLEDAIKLRTDQAANLSGLEGKPQLALPLRSHYAHVRSELLAEVCTMKKQLQVLVEAQQQPTQEQRHGRVEARQQPTQKNNCSQAVIAHA